MSEFDDYADSYTDAVQNSIDFCGQELEYFTRRKAEHLLEIMRRNVGDPARLSVLDVGCGVGATDALLASDVGDLHGVDMSSESVERARHRNPTVTYRAYAGEELPYADASMDVAFAICVLHHVDVADRAAFVAELRRVVRPGGLVVVFEHNPYNPLTRKVVRDCPFDEGVVLIEQRTARNLLSEAGLRPFESRYIIYFPFDKRFVAPVERKLGWLPLGAQHYVAARR
jgi:ubiquinone/menaquinone biosynthesis C-methylase UbiE